MELFEDSYLKIKVYQIYNEVDYEIGLTEELQNGKITIEKYDFKANLTTGTDEFYIKIPGKNLLSLTIKTKTNVLVGTCFVKATIQKGYGRNGIPIADILTGYVSNNISVSYPPITITKPTDIITAIIVNNYIGPMINIDIPTYPDFQTKFLSLVARFIYYITASNIRFRLTRQIGESHYPVLYTPTTFNPPGAFILHAGHFGSDMNSKVDEHYLNTPTDLIVNPASEAYFGPTRIDTSGELEYTIIYEVKLNL